MYAPHLLRLLIWYCILTAIIVEGSDDQEENTGITLEMLHRHSPSLNSAGPPRSRIDRTRQLLEGDNVRRHILTSHWKKTRTNQLTAWIPVHSGSDFGQGQYFVSLRVGSPHPQKVVLVTDTGSDLTWMNCEYACKDCPKSNPHPGRIFRASESSSFKAITCSSDICKVGLVDFFSLNKCPSPNAPCLFDYRYLSGQQAIGVFANETLTVGLHNNRHKIRMHDVLIGCTKAYNDSGEGFPDGVMGLGYRNHSLAIRLAEMFGNKFSYCLVDHLSSSDLKNYLSFGDISLVDKPKMVFTELLAGYISSFYAVNVSGISVGNKRLNIPSEIWDVKGEGGMILDSGTSLTMLSGSAYDQVIDAYRPSLSKFEKVDPATYSLPDFEFCFGLKGYNDSLVPNFVIHFGDGTTFEPPTANYIIDVAEGVKCLGISRMDWPGTSVLGNIIQQNHFWEFNIGEGKLGFGPSSCILSESSKSNLILSPATHKSTH